MLTYKLLQPMTHKLTPSAIDGQQDQYLLGVVDTGLLAIYLRC